MKSASKCGQGTGGILRAGAVVSLGIQKFPALAAQESQETLRNSSRRYPLPFPTLLPTSCSLELLLSGNVQENYCISDDLSSLSQGKTRLAKNVSDFCVENKERESSRRKGFVFHSPQPCS